MAIRGEREKRTNAAALTLLLTSGYVKYKDFVTWLDIHKDIA
jgi:hypothetical protein